MDGYKYGDEKRNMGSCRLLARKPVMREFIMKALGYHGRDIRCDTVPDPKIEDGRDAIIKVTARASEAPTFTSPPTSARAQPL